LWILAVRIANPCSCSVLIFDVTVFRLFSFKNSVMSSGDENSSFDFLQSTAISGGKLTRSLSGIISRSLTPSLSDFLTIVFYHSLSHSLNLILSLSFLALIHSFSRSLSFSNSHSHILSLTFFLILSLFFSVFFSHSLFLPLCMKGDEVSRSTIGSFHRIDSFDNSNFAFFEFDRRFSICEF